MVLTEGKTLSKNIVDDSINRMKTNERAYKKALHVYYIGQAEKYMQRPDTQCHLVIVFRLTTTQVNGTKQEIVDSAAFRINPKTSKYTLEDNSDRHMSILPTGCSNDGRKMLEDRDSEQWSGPSSPPPTRFH